MTTLIACEQVDWRFRCPKQWDDLEETGQAGLRYCSACKKTVFFCDSFQELSLRSREGRCVAFQSNEGQERMLVGRPNVPYRQF